MTGYELLSKLNHMSNQDLALDVVYPDNGPERHRIMDIEKITVEVLIKRKVIILE